MSGERGRRNLAARATWFLVLTVGGALVAGCYHSSAGAKDAGDLAGSGDGASDSDLAIVWPPEPACDQPGGSCGPQSRCHRGECVYEWRPCTRNDECESDQHCDCRIGAPGSNCLDGACINWRYGEFGSCSGFDFTIPWYLYCQTTAGEVCNRGIIANPALPVAIYDDDPARPGARRLCVASLPALPPGQCGLVRCAEWDPKPDEWYRDIWLRANDDGDHFPLVPECNVTNNRGQAHEDCGLP